VATPPDRVASSAPVSGSLPVVPDGFNGVLSVSLHEEVLSRQKLRKSSLAPPSNAPDERPSCSSTTYNVTATTT
jgi:hypothetical protein